MMHYVIDPRLGLMPRLGNRPKFEASRCRAEGVRPPSAMSSSTSSQGVVDRVQNFISENKHAILIGTAAALVAVGGVAYYASSSRGPGGDVEKGEGKKDKKKSKKRKTVKDEDGPILEERNPKPAVVEEEEKDYPAEEIASMPTEERTKVAASLKAKGNTAYQSRRFATAIDYYSRAIAVTPKPEPVFFSNRAACYVNLNPPQLEKVVEDCDAALALDRKYLKALNRRATALEALERYEEALRDFTAAAILDQFQNMSAAEAVERVLKKLATNQAQQVLSTREKRLPSHMFTSAYFGAFRPRPPPQLPETPTTGDNTLILALEALNASDYAHAFTLVNEAIEQGISWDGGKAEALNLRGTFKFLMTDVDGAKADFLSSLELQPSLTQSWVKIASVWMEQSEPDKAFESFEEAIKHNPEDPDIYYHRGQVLFIMNEFAQAAENYTKSTELDDKFVFSHIQLAVAQYKSGNLANSMATFRRTLKAFPDRSEPQNYYGELLMDQQRYPDAIEKFDRAIEIERAKAPPMNVLPMVNKGLALFQWQQDTAAAEKCCQEALEIDPECDAAVATLAQLSLQQGKIDAAMKMFDKQSQLARSEPELINALTYQYATDAQVQFMHAYPEMAAQLGQMARML
ncbi:ADP/ATP carrier receptor [Daedaleopsis nitida]|nr:ADP/ATP carrier receptor [Daedaleopsis nitida]